MNGQTRLQLRGIDDAAIRKIVPPTERRTCEGITHVPGHRGYGYYDPGYERPCAAGASIWLPELVLCNGHRHDSTTPIIMARQAMFRQLVVEAWDRTVAAIPYSEQENP